MRLSSCTPSLSWRLQQDQGPAYENFSRDQLDNLLSPVALYPDPLLAQLFVAATFPDQVEEAARFVRANGPNGVDEQDWDVSVRSIAHYRTVIGMMADKIDWTTSLGQAYVNQSTDVELSVQHLRRLARTVGNLQSSEQQEVLEHDNYVAITPYQPEYVYVPVYDPRIIYYRRPYYGPAITIGVGFPIGAWLNLDFHWGYGGGWGGLYYTGWRSEGWGSGCWNCGWIGRSRGRVSFQNNVYVNNRYNNISVNRNVINRSVNANNLNRYNSVHRNVGYSNVQVNNNRANRMTNADNGRPGNGAWNNGNNGRAGDRRVNNGNNARPGDRPLNTGYNARANNTPSGSGRGNSPGDVAGNYGSPNSQPAGNDRPPQPTRTSTATSIAAIRASTSTAAATTMPAMAVLHGVDARGAMRRHVTRCDGHSDQEHGDASKSQWVMRTDAEKLVGHETRQSQCGAHAEGDADQRHPCPCPITSRNTSLRCAPRAIRTPIS